ncbi:cyclic nucleotide-binding domain-containing protein [Chitinophaga niabensis]|uniref:cAMP-binding domain of CRP or a regulatory subunit of cAMP-dependent protein kinases n=1 Tax=Chitinophaga niabensis TaxID=536979 RepID=A0A1N6JY97_9BACT|nr:hypothetical protein [Chitinophaga niabensis]SIO49233.1 hypothetical protein SAMN04488055_4678 [Chitinophaga niabensis]
MKNFDQEEAYPTLFKTFREILPVPLMLVQDFTQRSVAIEFKKNDVITDGGQLSEYSYFIISGLVMCYTAREGTNLVRWIRSENDYAYSMDIFRLRLGYDPNLVGNILIALEDTLVIRIRHEDISWLQDNSVEMGIIVNNFMLGHSTLEQQIPVLYALAPLERYKEMQGKVSFELGRVPDIYLASYLNLTLTELKNVREKIA